MGGHPLFFPCLLFIKLNKTLRELPLISRVSRKKNMFIQGGKYIFNLNLCSAQMSSVTNHTFRSLLQVMVFDWWQLFGLLWHVLGKCYLFTWSFFLIHGYWWEACVFHEFIGRISWLGKLWKNKVVGHEKCVDLRDVRTCSESWSQAQYFTQCSFWSWIHLHRVLDMLFNTCSWNTLG